MIQDEMNRLMHGPLAGQRIGGLGSVRFLIITKDTPQRVLDKVREVLRIVLAQSKDRWLSLEEWRQILPAWFIRQCRAERTKKEAEEWLKSWKLLSNEEQERVSEEDGWSLDNWLYWFEPKHRTWRWWDAVVESPRRIRLAVEAHDWPLAWDALGWLFKSSGAQEVMAEE